MSWLHWFDNSELVGFYALGLVAIIASLRVIILANPVHAILSMIVTLLALAGIFFIVGAPFAGALQVIVYAGAILVLFVFVIMMLNLGIKNDSQESKWLSSEVWAVPTGLTIIIALVIFSMINFSIADVDHAAAGAPALMGLETVSSKSVGISLFSHYIMLVEVAAMLLLAALVAAYHLGKKALDDENVSHSSRDEDNRQIVGHYTAKDLENDELHSKDSDIKPYEYQPVKATDFEATRISLDNVASPKAKSTARDSLLDNASLQPTRPTTQGDSQ